MVYTKKMNSEFLPKSDPRTPYEFTEDYVDAELIDFYIASGLLEYGPGKPIDHIILMAFVRTAWARGIEQALQEPERMHRFMGIDYTTAQSNLTQNKEQPT